MPTFAFYAKTDAVDDEKLNKIYYGLPQFRKDYVDKITDKSSKKNSVCAFYLLLKVLNELGEKTPLFFVDRFGKPFLKNSRYFINISHSNNIVFCVVSTKKVGCDVEYIKKVNIPLLIKKFSLTEQCFFTFDIDKNTENFFRLWTLKESFVKCIGLGLNCPLNSFSVNLKPLKIEQNFDKENYFFNEYNVDKNYKFSVCSQDNNFENIKEILL